LSRRALAPFVVAQRGTALRVTAVDVVEAGLIITAVAIEGVGAAWWLTRRRQGIAARP
jgi:hypothetical protein